MQTKHFLSSLPQRERRIVLLVIAGAVFLTAIPYLVGWLVAGSRYTYLAVSPLAPGDTNVYFSFMKQVEHGAVFVENLHTSEPQYGSIFHPLWLVLGWTAGLFHLPIPVVFHLARSLFIVLLLLVIYRVLTELFAKPRRRLIAFVLVTFASGVGTLFSIGLSLKDSTQIEQLLPADQWVSESITFLTLLHSPLFILSQLLLLFLLWSFVHEQRERPVFLFALTFLIGIIHPYDLVTVAFFVPALLLVRFLWQVPVLTSRDTRQYVRRMFAAAAGAFFALVYYFAVTHSQPAIGDWLKQNITLSPPPHSYLIGYGFLWVFAVVGFALLRTTHRKEHLFLLTWTLVSVLLLYIPLQINRRLSNGLHIPLAILAGVGIDVIWQWLARRFAHRPFLRTIALSAVGWTLCLGLFFSSFVVITRAVYWEKDPTHSTHHVDNRIIRAVDWLGMNAKANAVVLSHPFVSNFLPARTGLRVYVGHGHQTIHYEQKMAWVLEWFYKTNNDDAAKIRFLRSGHVNYVFFGPLEDRIGTFNPAEKSYLQKVYDQDDVVVYRVLQ